MGKAILAAIGGLVALFVLLDLTDFLLARAGKRPLPGWRRRQASHFYAGEPGGGGGIRPARHLVQVVVIVAALVLAIIVVIKWAPAWLASNDHMSAVQRAEDVGRVRTALLATLAGLIAVVGAYYTSRTFALNRLGQTTERFTRAIDQLGSKVLDVRIGGIYALDRLARESRGDYGPIMEIFAAYVRDHAPLRAGAADGAADARKDLTKQGTDVQVVLAILVRPRVNRAPAPDLSFTALPGARFRDAHLEGANLKGAHLPDADLSYAHLQKAMLEGANLQTVHNLKSANLQGTTYDAATVWPKDVDPVTMGAVKTGVRRRLILCCDGLWNTADQAIARQPVLTNVAKIYQSLAPADSEGAPQFAFYLRGRSLRLSRLQRQVLDCYRFIVENFEPGDELFFFGFSRGAYIARTVAGLVRYAGILRPDHTDRVDEACALYRDRRTHPQGTEARSFRRYYSYETRIRFIGVWDTVGPLGVPLSGLRFVNAFNRRWQFHDTDLSTTVDAAFHALAIDEKRRPFQPAVWQQGENAKNQRLEQVWFAGVHGDVGGGYQDASLADVALLWMADRAQSCGLTFRPDAFPSGIPARTTEEVVVRPDAMGQLHESQTASYRLRRPFNRPIGVKDPAHEYASSTAVQRREKDPQYAPPGLVAYLAHEHKVMDVLQSVRQDR